VGRSSLLVATDPTDRKADSVGESRPRASNRPAKGALRAKLIAAALEHFATRPYDEVTVGEIARAAGVAHGLLFHYFETKRGLYLAALEHAGEQLVVAHQTDPAAPPGARIRQLLSSHLEHLAANEHVALNLILRGAGNDAAAYQAFERNRWEMTDWVCELLGLDPANAAARSALRSFARATDEATAQWLAGGQPIEIDVVVEGLLELLVGALRAATKWDPDLVAGGTVERAVEELRRPSEERTA
jgi:AcrR family transcriptional regulator